MEVYHVQEKGRRNYTLQFDYEGRLLVKTDYNFLPRQVNDLLEKHKTWIRKHFKIISENLRQVPIVKIANGEIVPLFGDKFIFRFRESDTKRITFEIKGKSIYVFYPKKTPKYLIKEKFIRFIKTVAKGYFIERTEFYANLYGFKYKRVAIKEQKTKWGSCSSLGNLNYNWHLIFAPKDVSDYVVAHEVCHLKEMNHSKRFWNLVEKHCPSYQEKRKFLRENEFSIRVKFS